MSRQLDIDEPAACCELLGKIYGEKQEAAAMQIIYHQLFELRSEARFTLIDRVLEEADVERLSPPLLLALLTITSPIKQRLQKRADFFARTGRAITAQRGAEAAGRALVGLE
jgi:hypothetical protein